MKVISTRSIGTFLLTIIGGFQMVWAQGDATAINPGVPWPATDGLGRSLPVSTVVGPPRTDRFVGIFYFLWHNQRGGKSPHWDGPYDVSKILSRDPAALRNSDSPLWGPIGMYHYWGEPIYGYYLSTDPWVLRRHAYLLADAGVDTLIFDTTNAVIYRDVYRQLCQVFERIREEGDRTPQIAFMVNTQAGNTAQQIYEDLYQKGDYRELWFRWQGKPLMICDPADASGEVREFFTLRRAHWPFERVNTPYAWHWEAAYPQVYGYTVDPSVPEQVNVSVAQNLRLSDGLPTNMSSGDARGRSYHDGRIDPEPDAVKHGYNFQEQWQRAFELDPPFVMVTGWNEWIAGRFGDPGKPLVFVDQFTQETSRDIEPMQGGHADHYYWQMVANLRRFRGVPAPPTASAPLTISTDDRFRPWRDVQPEFRDHLHETDPRDFDGAAGLHYSNHTGRNDLQICKVARDEHHLYFYLQCREPIALPVGANGPYLLIDVDQKYETGWEGFEFLVNRSVENRRQTWLERHASGGQWQRVCPVRYRVAGRELHLAIPRADLGLALGSTAVSIDFKWVDHLQHPHDIMDVYLSGDVAPEGRFKFRYTAE